MQAASGWCDHLGLRIPHHSHNPDKSQAVNSHNVQVILCPLQKTVHELLVKPIQLQEGLKFKSSAFNKVGIHWHLAELLLISKA